MVYFRVLGPLIIERVEAAAAQVLAPMLRRLVAALLCRAGQPASPEELVYALWGEIAPPKARKSLQVYVRRLRIAIGEDRVTFDGAGYRLQVAADEVDSVRFARGVAMARAARGEAAAELYARALALWSGPAYEDVRDHPPIADEARRLDEERLRVEAEFAALRLHLGRHDELVPHLTKLVAAHPFHEDLRAHLMLAYYRCGRQADALELLRDTRRLLNEELGIEPGPGLQRLQVAILRRAPELDAESASPRELPPPAAGFVGRHEELEALDGVLPGSSPVVISAIVGPAGVGKTALAVHWGHLVAEEFPDGQLYLNLNGFASSPPMRPIDALASMLRSIGVPLEKVPIEQAEAAALFRTRMAGRRMLVLLDNARSEEQVRPLLPGGTGTLVLVTSRHRLSGLAAAEGARRLNLDVLSPQDARDLLDHMLGTGKTAAESDATTELARACANLPLALRIAAANLNDRPHRSVRDHVRALLSNDRLDALAVDGDQEVAVRVAFDQSYLDVPAEGRRTFRLLGLLPGADFSLEAVAAVTGMLAEDAERQLMRLAAANLINQIAPDRFMFHDLLRLYASERATQDETGPARAEAIERYYAWCQDGVDSAAQLLYPTLTRLPADRPDRRGRFGSPDRAVEWLDAERANLVAAIEQAANLGPHPAAWTLADGLRGYFPRRKYVAEWLATANMALQAAMTANDRRAQASAHITFAHASRSRHMYGQARDHLEQAAQLIKGTNWDHGLVAVLINLGGVYFETGTMAQAAVKAREALRLSRRVGYGRGEALATSNLGLILGYAGQLTKAEMLLRASIELNRRIGNPQSESAGLADLGTVLHQLARSDEAHEALSTAVHKKRLTRDRLGEALTLAELAIVCCDIGQVDAARDHAQRALMLAEEMDDHQALASALVACGFLGLAESDNYMAIEQFRHAREIASDVGINYPEVSAKVGLAVAFRLLGESETAFENAQAAVTHARNAGFSVREGQALNLLAAIRLDAGSHGEARRLAEQALGIHRRTGHVRGEVDALAILTALGSPGVEPD